MRYLRKQANGLYSRLYYSFQKYISIQYDITITLNTSGSKWTGSIIIYKVVHGPKFIQSRLKTIDRPSRHHTIRQTIPYRYNSMCKIMSSQLVYNCISTSSKLMTNIVQHKKTNSCNKIHFTQKKVMLPYILCNKITKFPSN